MVRVYIYKKKNIYCIVYTVYTPKCSWSGREAGISTTFYYELGLISNWAFQKLIEGGYTSTGLSCSIRALISCKI